MEGPSQFRDDLGSFEGALWGAVLGDVIGAHLQFQSLIDKQMVQRALKIPGGGQHKLQPGQPTDDSELNYAVCNALLEGHGKLNLNFIARSMADWFLSKPIDIGNTIRKSVPKACNMTHSQAYLVRKAAAKESMKSQSNGSLMALIGLSLWSFRLPFQQLVTAIDEFTQLIHPNPTVRYVNCYYALVVQQLLVLPRTPKVGIEALLEAAKILKENQHLEHITQFLSWLSEVDAIYSIEMLRQAMKAARSPGWVKVALFCFVVFLKLDLGFQKSITQLIALGGDTDTNACIVGGLLGVRYGRGVLEEMKEQIKVISQWHPVKRNRPAWMIPGRVIPLYMKGLLEAAPKQLNMIGSNQK